MTPLFFELAFVMCLAAFFGLVARALRVPTLIAYLATGVVVGALHLSGTTISQDTFSVFSDLGVMFLLFLIGLEINYASLRFVGKPAFVIGVTQVVVTSLVGVAIAYGLGFSWMAAGYIGIALSFSSTVVVMKLLSDKRDVESLYGKLSVGMLLVQDVIALFVLTVLTGIGGDTTPSLLMGLFAVGKAIVVLGVVFWMGRTIFPFLVDAVGDSPELLFLVSIAWLFVFVAFVSWMGFSIEIAGFLAGLALANSFMVSQIATRIRPLRDFFIIVFFVTLGASLAVTELHAMFIPLITLTLFVLIGDPLIVLIIMGIMGYSKRTSFFTSVTSGQISEFSFILAAVGLRLHQIPPSITALITAIGIITFIVSAYGITESDVLFARLRTFLSFFERAHHKKDKTVHPAFSKPFVLLGYHRTGVSIARHFPKHDLLIIDFDPEVFQELKREGYACIFGDIGDGEVFEKVRLEEARIIISTIPHIEDNLLLLRIVNATTPRPKCIVRADNEREALALYKEGADYVLLPHMSSGHHLGKAISTSAGIAALHELRDNDIELMHQGNNVKK
ncbi:MAG: cation:proton antiporter [Patescibacteria group bacterium]|nr:cation:proton antiporter [Patescibacteria group bacterium]MDE2438598.1 cation:proton antiporter [Patescibacteria group bacterium]